MHAVKRQIEVVAILELKKAAFTNQKAGNSNEICTLIKRGLVKLVTLEQCSITVVQLKFEFPALG